MQLNVSQQMKMSQQMKLAPRMIQSMEILQLPIMALQERIDQELEENVCLEVRSKERENATETERTMEIEKAREEATEKNPDQKEMVSEENNESDFERLLDISEEWPEDNVSAGSRVSSNRVSDELDRQHDLMSNMVARPQSLQDYLLEQFGLFKCDREIRDFGQFLIQNLDHNGRLPTTLPEVMQVFGRPITLEQAEEALGLVQRCEPPGVGARDLKECLLLQIQPEMPYRDVVVTLITDHLDDLSQNRLPIIQRKTGYDIETIKAAVEEMRHVVDPYPGRGFEEQPVQRVTPDLSVEQDGEGKWVVTLIDEYTPELRISKRYISMLRNNPDQKTKEYIKKKIESAKWLIESIEQRNNTLRKVAQAIVDHQSDFLEQGPEAIQPLKMQQIADKVGVHVTTVSRAVDDKWIQTPRGLFPLKRFFGGGTQTEDGEEVAWDIIRLKLKAIIDNEDKSNPLSDDALVEALAKEGYQLARRTVTKYRKNMDIPSSRQRREY
jgi:RNA polymerase sigma-54 factor